MKPVKSAQQKNRSMVRTLILSCVLMFGFGFALVPLYDVFCRITGLNGKVLNTGPNAPTGSDKNRTIRVQMIAVNNESMPWEFRALSPMVTVYPGESKQAAYLAHNPTSEKMVAQAIPSVSPSEAAQYLHKVNCFCFDRQPLDSLETREMPLLFVIDPELPTYISTITLSYTLFDITSTKAAESDLLSKSAQPNSTGRNTL
ncbi:cytochrome c oxidase assembly protein [Neptunomonas qingdaonensis]|uniref:Cytochrome c oxidase assembly protein CtaG n=1 Tax=Neptunomonas qingdaonensis TaxID=1045558 RepID=A0A1I2M4K9_9GAMM|nr:cytochrome c oxidase assembly protein [Neptunomonas qingdaonensis]SFF85798.1 cytochrome c oxidase assembly protein subunit 11 [Neptunomonas qingdaonensis]